MRTIKGIMIPILTILLVGCMQDDAGDDPGQENMNSQPIKYETEQEQNERRETDNNQNDEQNTYPENDYQNVNEGDDQAQSDKFTNEVSQSISNHLKQRRDVRQAQVAVSEDKVIVGVMLTDQAPPDMRERVEQEVQEMVPTKDVHVYTDDIYWDRMRNKDAQLDQLNGDMREYLREFFDRDREHF
ncbi:YhcN/YlaJ family sporulation lipoprotein [Lentibacillus salinarum]|uniref:YhcN/YlaJ family sporulation lipoprotein n=1 Tax=Lentibacillus salinarum TaxID=446820 RepID=A0ABW3ZYN9_9BACI